MHKDLGFPYDLAVKLDCFVLKNIFLDIIVFIPSRQPVGNDFMSDFKRVELFLW